MGSPGTAVPNQLPAGVKGVGAEGRLVPPRIEIKGGAIINRGGETDSEEKKFIRDEVRKLSALRQHTVDGEYYGSPIYFWGLADIVTCLLFPLCWAGTSHAGAGQIPLFLSFPLAD